jgi:hypothetical protein
MIIILKKIPGNTLDFHVETFIEPVLKGGLFSASGRIESISFWRYEIVQSNSIEYYALVDIEPDSVGKRVIKQLNKKQINGKYIGLQEFHVRHWSNDRRVFKSVVDRGKNNKRKADRRRKIVKIEKRLRPEETRVENITISSHSGFWAEPHDAKGKKS